MAGVVAFLAVVALVPGRADRATAPPPAAARLSPHDILLAAANQAAATESSRYWHTRLVELVGPVRVGIAPHQYYLLRREVNEVWVARAPADRSWNGYRQLGYRPRADADERAWQAAGSPRQWVVPTDSERLVDAPGQPRLQPIDASTDYLRDEGGFNLTEVQQLPTDPTALRQLFGERIARDGLPSGSDGFNMRLFGSMTELLITVPAPARVRAAAFTVLSGIPGIRSAGTVKDSQGRAGLGIEMVRTSNDGLSEYRRLIVDPATHLILADDYVAQLGTQPAKERHVTVVKSEWTDQLPTPPAIP
jgi:hypothetical protein